MIFFDRGMNGTSQDQPMLLLFYIWHRVFTFLVDALFLFLFLFRPTYVCTCIVLSAMACARALFPKKIHIIFLLTNIPSVMCFEHLGQWYQETSWYQTCKKCLSMQTFAFNCLHTRFRSQPIKQKHFIKRTIFILQVRCYGLKGLWM